MALSRVWVDDGCILCNLCVEVAPDVFVIEDDHCFVRAEAEIEEHEEPIRQLAIDCPVSVIRYEED